VPFSVTVPAGSTSASFTITTKPVTSNKTGAIKAAYDLLLLLMFRHVRPPEEQVRDA
jgi:hypothetical protein